MHGLAGGVVVKTCKKCLEEKELKEFGLLRRSSDGLSNICGECRRELDRKRRHTIEFHNLPHQRRVWGDQMMKHLRINARDY
jgi:hypothetical protein